MSITALRLLKAAAAQGWWFTVDQGDEDDGPIKTKSAVKAWELVKEVDEANVYVWQSMPDGKSMAIGWAYLMAPSKITCSPEESLVNYSVASEGMPASPFQIICDRLIEEEMG